MAKYNKSVTYEIDSHSKGGQFSIPQETLNALGITQNDRVQLKVENAATGVMLFEGEKDMRSGTEIYGPEMKQIGSKQKLRVTVSKA